MSQVKAEERLTLRKGTLSALKHRHREFWQAKSEEAKRARGKDQMGPWDHVPKEIPQGALLVSMGLGIDRASCELGLGKRVLKHLVAAHWDAWVAELEKSQRLLTRIGYDRQAVLLEPLRKTFEQVAELLAKGVQVYQDSAERKRLGRINCPWSVTWRGLRTPAQSKVIGTREEAERFATVKRRKFTFAQVSRDLGKSPAYLNEKIRAYPDLWEKEAKIAGLPEVWGPEFYDISLHGRLLLARAAKHRATGLPVGTAARRAGSNISNLYEYIKRRKRLWEHLVEREQDVQGISPGTAQKVRLVGIDGRPLPANRRPQCGRSDIRDKPKWDKRKGELRLQGRLARKVDVHRAKNVACILTIFEESGWPESMDDPLRHKSGLDSVERLRHAIKVLNSGLRYLRFGTEGGNSILWRVVAKGDD